MREAKWQKGFSMWDTKQVKSYCLKRRPEVGESPHATCPLAAAPALTKDLFCVKALLGNCLYPSFSSIFTV